MTRARNVLLADRCRASRPRPTGVNGPTMKTSSRPITSGGSRSTRSRPASHTRGNGSRPRASSQASGVPSTSRTASVTAPDSTETTSGSRAPGLVRAVLAAPGEMCVSRVMTGPSRASQMTRAAATDTAPDAERIARGERGPPGPPGPPGPADGRRPGPESSRTPLPAAATLLAAEPTLHLGGLTAARQLRGEQRVPALLVQGQALLGEHVGGEFGARRALVDRGDVDDQR